MGTKKEKKVIEPTRLDTLKKEADELRALITENVQLANETEDSNELRKALASADENVKKWNEKSKEIYIEDAITAGNSIQIMEKVVLNPNYKRLNVRQDKESGTYQVNESNAFCDLSELNKKAKGGIGHDKNWVHKAAKLNYIVAYRKTEEIHRTKESAIEALKSWEMKDAARAVLFPAEIDPLKDAENKPKENIISRKNLLAALKLVITDMIGEEYAKKLISCHVSYIENAYCSHDKKTVGGGIKLSNDKQFVRLLADVCYRIMTNTDFNITGGNIKK